MKLQQRIGQVQGQFILAQTVAGIAPADNARWDKLHAYANIEQSNAFTTHTEDRTLVTNVQGQEPMRTIHYAMVDITEQEKDFFSRLRNRTDDPAASL